MSAPLEELTTRAVGEEALAELLAADAVVAVPDSARPFAVAALGRLVDAAVLLVVTPTSAEVDRIVHDLVQFVDPSRVERFPAWETLPFERVSPAAETMGARLRVLDRIDRAIRSPGVGGPLIIVASVKALLQRLATDDVPPPPFTVAVGDRLDPEEAVRWLVEMGYRREYQVEHRGELALRGGIIDVFPATGDTGIRIDCFGDDVERLTNFDVADQRSTDHLDHIEIVGCRELDADRVHVATRAAASSRRASFGRAEFARIAAGELFDGMESFLPWLVQASGCFPTCSASRTGSSSSIRAGREIGPPSCSTRRLASPRRSPPPGALPVRQSGGDDLPRLHLRFERILEPAARHGSRRSSGPGGELRRSVARPRSGWPAAIGDAGAIARRVGELRRRGHSIVVAADGEGSAERPPFDPRRRRARDHLDRSRGVATGRGPPRRRAARPRVHPRVRKARDPRRGRPHRASSPTPGPSCSSEAG